MNVVLTGGTGLVGRALTKALLSRRDAVTILSRSGDRSDPAGFDVVQWDARTIGPWAGVLAGADAVINLAGESIGARWTAARKKHVLDSRVQATQVLRDALLKTTSRPKIFVNASAVGYYGHVEEGDVTESAPGGDDFLARVTAAWEATAATIESMGIRVVRMRAGVVLSADAEAFKRMIIPFKLFAGGPFGSGRQWFPWIHLEDVVGGYLHAVSTPTLQGPVNLASPNPVRVSELAKALGRALRRPAVLPAPAFALRIALGEMSDLLLKGQRVVPKKLAETGFVFRYPELAGALEDILGRNR